MKMMRRLEDAMSNFYIEVEEAQKELGYTTEETWKNLESEFGEQVANGYRDWMGE